LLRHRTAETCAYPVQVKVSFPSILFVSAVIPAKRIVVHSSAISRFTVSRPKFTRLHTPEEDNGD
jgi:hypothetical protein